MNLICLIFLFASDSFSFPRCRTVFVDPPRFFCRRFFTSVSMTRYRRSVKDIVMIKNHFQVSKAQSTHKALPKDMRNSTLWNREEFLGQLSFVSCDRKVPNVSGQRSFLRRLFLIDFRRYVIIASKKKHDEGRKEAESNIFKHSVILCLQCFMYGSV